jgi:lysophospholipase L1-like esterase
MALVTFNTLLLFVAANLVAMYCLSLARDGPSPEEQRHEQREAAFARYGIDLWRRLYPDRTDAQIRAIVMDQAELRSAYEPFAEFRNRAILAPTFAIHQAGFRLNGKQQGPWPPDARAINIFVFGGSTTIGVALPDEQTIPAQLQAILRDRDTAGRIDINVYNFGVGASFSSQEVAFLQNLIRAGHVPDMAVFVDGLNDFHFWDGEPATAKTARHLYDVIAGLNQRLGREQGVSWHMMELLKSLPLTKLAERVANQTPGSVSAGPSGLAAPAAERDDGETADFDAASNDAVYARRYKDGPEITDPSRIQAVIRRYLTNKAIVQGIGDQLGMETMFAWQPIPLYKYDLRIHPFPIANEHRRSRYGYPMFAKHVADHDMGRNFAWCADVLQNARQPRYIDQVHYTASGSRPIAQCIADRILASGALERIRQGKVGRNSPAAAIAVAQPSAPRPFELVARVFGSKALAHGIEMSHPLGTWDQHAQEGVRLNDVSDDFGLVYESLPLDPAATDRVYQARIRLKPSTSSYFGLVLSCLGGSRSESSVIFLDPETMGVISATGYYDIAPEPDGWVRLTLERACSDPGSGELRISLYPVHGKAQGRGSILFGGGEIVRKAGQVAP